MENINLKPMRIGEIFDINFQILRKNFQTLINLNLMIFLPCFILFCLAGIALFLIYLSNPMMFSGFRATHPDVSLMGFIFLGVIALFGLIFVASFSFLFNKYGIFQIYNAAIHGGKITWKASLKGSILGVLYFFVAGILMGIPTFILTFPLRILSQFMPLFIIPTMIIAYGIMVFFFITHPLIAVEKSDPIRSLWRSCTLIWRNFGRALAVFLLYIVLSISAYLVLLILTLVPIVIWLSTAGKELFQQQQFDPSILLNPWLLMSALLIISFIMFLGFVLFNFYNGLQVILMYDLKMRSEGYGILPSENTISG